MKYILRVSMGLVGSGSVESDPEKSQLSVTLNAQRARHGARPGPKLAGSVQPRSQEREKKCAAGSETHGCVQKKCIRYIPSTHWHIGLFYISSNNLNCIGGT